MIHWMCTSVLHKKHTVCLRPIVIILKAAFYIDYNFNLLNIYNWNKIDLALNHIWLVQVLHDSLITHKNDFLSFWIWHLLCIVCAEWNSVLPRFQFKIGFRPIRRRNMIFVQNDDVIMSDVIKGFRGHDFPLRFRFWILEWRQPFPMISWSLIGSEKIQKP